MIFFFLKEPLIIPPRSVECDSPALSRLFPCESISWEKPIWRNRNWNEARITLPPLELYGSKLCAGKLFYAVKQINPSRLVCPWPAFFIFFIPVYFILYYRHNWQKHGTYFHNTSVWMFWISLSFFICLLIKTVLSFVSVDRVSCATGEQKSRMNIWQVLKKNNNCVIMLTIEKEERSDTKVFPELIINFRVCPPPLFLFAPSPY